MKAIISSTYDNQYMYFLPIVTWLWNKLGVDVICFMPQYIYFEDSLNVLNKGKQVQLIEDVIKEQGLKCDMPKFDAPEHKEATYAQCSRLYGACLDLPIDEILITSDVDMAVFKLPPYINDNTITIFGSDLVPPNQFPMCYASANVKYFGESMGIFDTDYNPIQGDFISSKRKTYQEKLDELLGHIEAEHFRGNYWGKDQEELYSKTWEDACLMDRSNGENQFATKRYDRDDSYILDRLSPDTIDFHMNRPGFEDKNFEIILTILKYHYPQEDFTWLVNYTEQYKQLL